LTNAQLGLFFRRHNCKSFMLANVLQEIMHSLRPAKKIILQQIVTGLTKKADWTKTSKLPQGIFDDFFL
jgi:Cdc6-like AAA superfamily ATPase